MTIKELTKIANTKKEYLMEDFELVEKTNGLFKNLVLFFMDDKGNLSFDEGYNRKKINGAYVIIEDQEMIESIPNVTLETTVDEMFDYAYKWYGLERGAK